MIKFYIKTTDSTTIITADHMFLDGNYLYVYNGEELYGMYKADAVIDAHRTEAR